MIVKPFNYSDLYSSNKKTKLDTIKSTRYRMGPISILLEFNTKVIISDYLNENKIKLKDILRDANYEYLEVNIKKELS